MGVKTGDRAAGGLLILAAIGAVAAPPAAAFPTLTNPFRPGPHRPRDEPRAVTAALERCLRATPARPLRASPRPVPATGIADPANVRAWRLAAANGPAIAYVGTDPGIARCGIAFYGPVTNESIQRLLGPIARVPRLRRQSPDVLPVASGPADRLYWGDPLAPALRGVLLTIRAPGPGLPTLAIESHASLVR